MSAGRLRFGSVGQNTIERSLTALEVTQFQFELSKRRFDTTSTIFCALYKVEDWIPRLGGGTYAESITECYCHTAFRVETGDMNMRAVYAGEVCLS